MKDVNPGFEMVRTGSNYNPLQSTANMLGALGFPGAMSYPSMMGSNPQLPQLLQSKLSAMLSNGTCALDALDLRLFLEAMQ